MLTIKQITENKEGVIKGLEKKLFKDARKNIDAVLAQNDCRREAQGRLDATLQLINAKSKEIGTLMRDGKRDEAEAAKAFVSARKEEAKAIEAEMDNAAAAMKALLLNIPNVPYDEVPEGKDANDNEVVKTGGQNTVLPENPLPHWELARKYDLIDFDLGVKITGAGFPVYRARAHACNAR